MSTPTPTPPVIAEAPRVDESLVTYTHVIYALHALAVLIGVTTLHTIVLSFVGGLPSLIAVIMNYARRSATRGTYLESHFRWQIRTFWYALLWLVVCGLLAVTIIGIPLALLGYAALAVWIIYRVARGWLALKDGRPMYV
ncbi:MAG: hypothetical protein JO158_03615 [Gammaproteobacteria bacterium]|nr:hypothetical protein [Gammaproteobacteria bacterium]MBV9726942.1 hypothetical protein [Gammaproteobacteria bacterium]